MIEFLIGVAEVYLGGCLTMASLLLLSWRGFAKSDDEGVGHGWAAAMAVFGWPVMIYDILLKRD